MNITTLAAGDYVALSLSEGAAPIRCYVGEIQEVDATGVRITLMDWIIGEFAGYDLFAPWPEITSALVCTKNHNPTHFGDKAGQWQEDMDRPGQPGAISQPEPHPRPEPWTPSPN